MSENNRDSNRDTGNYAAGGSYTGDSDIVDTDPGDGGNDISPDSGDGGASLSTRGLATFGSTHHVLKAEKLLLEAGLDVRMVPMPREVSSDCGVALEFAYELAPEVQDTAREAGLEVKKIHRLAPRRQT